MEWATLLEWVGKGQDDPALMNLASDLGEKPKMSMSPLIHGDSEGRSLYQKFLKNGIELGFRAQRLSQVHLYVQPHEGYAAFVGKLLDQHAKLWTRDDLVKTLGLPEKQGGDKLDGLLGYIRPWIRYKKAGLTLHAEFSEDGRLWKLTLMQEPRPGE